MIFVVGSSRSGTTLLGRMLGLHSEIHTFGELHYFEQLIGIEEFAENRPLPSARAHTITERLLSRANDGFFAPFSLGRHAGEASQILAQLSEHRPSTIYAAFLNQQSQKAGRRIPLEQTPRYLFAAEEILQTYPNARIICMIRDPRDVLISQSQKWKRRFLGAGNIPVHEAVRAWCNYHPWLVSRLWLSCVNYARAIKDNRFINIQFEDLILAPEDELRRVCRFIGVDFESEMLSPPQVGSSSGVDSPDQKGVDTGRASGWRVGKMPKRSRLICEWVCGQRMRDLGYLELLNGGRFSPEILISLFTLPVKVALSFAFNVKRFPHLLVSLERRLRQPEKHF